VANNRGSGIQGFGGYVSSRAKHEKERKTRKEGEKIGVKAGLRQENEENKLKNVLSK
jgi:hypothetical protein